MSKLARTLILAATVAALNLAGVTAIAHAQAKDEETTTQQQWAENGTTTSRRPGSRRRN